MTLTPNEKAGERDVELPLYTPVQTVQLQKRRVTQHLIPAILLFSALILLFKSVFVCHGHYDAGRGLLNHGDDASAQEAIAGYKVPLEAHIMSKCPDARDCLQQLVVPTMEQVSDKVDFKLSYIGRYCRIHVSYQASY